MTAAVRGSHVGMFKTVEAKGIQDMFSLSGENAERNTSFFYFIFALVS